LCVICRSAGALLTVWLRSLFPCEQFPEAAAVNRLPGYGWGTHCPPWQV